MNTFLPYPDFALSAKVLDNRRLGKQRIEAKQILQINLFKTASMLYVCDACDEVYLTSNNWHCDICGENALSLEFPEDLAFYWENHPAVLMWRGYELALAYYGFIICKEWKSRGFKDNQQAFFGNYCAIELNKFQPNINFWPNENDLDLYPNGGSFAMNNFQLFYESPYWLGNPKLHLSHQSNLLRKNWDYYIKYFGENIQDTTLPYYWPTKN